MTGRDSIVRTLAVAAGVALFCSLLVSTVVYWLRPIQLAYSSADRNRAVLVAAGLAEPGETLEDDELARRYRELEPRLVEIDTGSFAAADQSVIAGYDYRAAADDPGQTEAIPADEDIASLGRRPRLMPVFLRDGSDGLEGIVLTVYGRGMWSTIHGYVALESDLLTIDRVWFFEHGETPGIGDRIQNPDWLAQWQGKPVRAPDGGVPIRVGGDGGAEAGARVDSITGATVTATAVGDFVGYWLGPDGYGPFLENLRSRGY